MTFQLDLAEDAEADIDDILEWSVMRFGEAVRDGYEALIHAAFVSIVRDPECPGSRDWQDLGHGIRTLHLRTCRNEVSPTARRIANPRHFVAYRHMARSSRWPACCMRQWTSTRNASPDRHRNASPENHPESGFCGRRAAVRARKIKGTGILDAFRRSPLSNRSPLTVGKRPRMCAGSAVSAWPQTPRGAILDLCLASRSSSSSPEDGLGTPDSVTRSRAPGAWRAGRWRAQRP